MQTDSSAKRTCRLSRSASLNTATVAILSSRQARITRSAISPRLAIRTLRNIPLGTARPRAELGCFRVGRRFPQVLVRLHRLPYAIRGGVDALELEVQLVGVVAVLQRLFLGDDPLEKQGHDRLIERLHAVLRHALGHRAVNQRSLLGVQDELADGG